VVPYSLFSVSPETGTALWLHTAKAEASRKLNPATRCVRYRILANLRVLTGAADYGHLVVQAVFDIQ